MDPSWMVSLLSGGVAGTAVDVSLFPIDTIKTRLQSKEGFWKSGGFKRIYSGLGPAAVGSAPGAALFFCTYDTTKKLLIRGSDGAVPAPVAHMIGAALGEVAACLVRVPVEIVKQRRQAFVTGPKSFEIVRSIIATEGFRGLYRGYLTTILREIPFSLIQFPLWEQMKLRLSHYQNEGVTPFQSSLCGAFAGGFSAYLTTPVDVAKTRIMLASAESEIAKRSNILFTLQVVFKEKGLSGVFAGASARVLWISIGGAVFFGAYEQTKSMLVMISPK